MTLAEMEKHTANRIDTDERTMPGNTPWDHVAGVLRQHYHEPDIQAARVLYAAVAAHSLDGPPVWPMAVAPASTMKTELVRALEGLRNVHAIDSITSKTFISGQIRDKKDPEDAKLPPSSLLHRIGDTGIIVCADFSTILAIKADDRNAILADLRRIYDGDLNKEFGTSDSVPSWRGRITFVACVTPEIDNRYAAIQSLGDRFVMVRWDRAGEQAAIAAMLQDERAARNELRSAVHNLLTGLPTKDPAYPKEIVGRLAALADLATQARSHVTRSNGSDKAIVGQPQAESAPRLARQLFQLVKASALLDQRLVVTEQDFEVARRAAFDCIPARRCTMLKRAINDGDIGAVNSSTRTYDRDDLTALGLLDGPSLSDSAKRSIERIDPSFTRTPPNASGETTTGIAGIVLELVKNPYAKFRVVRGTSRE